MQANEIYAWRRFTVVASGREQCTLNRIRPLLEVTGIEGKRVEIDGFTTIRNHCAAFQCFRRGRVIPGEMQLTSGCANA